MAAAWLESAEAALNAVLGDYLERRGNALAIEMSLFHDGAPLVVTADALRSAHARMSSRIVVLVHGMAMTEACWSFSREPAQSYGALLRDELGLTPFYVRYNTGRRISHNGKDLALLLERLVDASPVPIEEINLIGHSMGGLVVRSACHHGEQLGLSWIRRTRRAFYLASPHLGAPLEKAGHLLSLALGAIDEPVVRLTHTLADLRSAGVKDLRHGTLLDDGAALPLCAGLAHYFVAGTLTGTERHWVAQLFGDSLVRLGSATDPGRRAGLPADHFVVLAGVHHMELARSPAVYAKIRDWFGPSPGEPEPRGSAAGPRVAEEEPVPPLKHRAGTLERLDAYRALLQDAVEEGTTAVQQVHEELAARPYDSIELFPPLRPPVKLVRAAHFAAVRVAYDAIRGVNRVVGTALHEGIAWLKDERERRPLPMGTLSGTTSEIAARRPQ